MIQEKNDNVLIGHINDLQSQIDTLSGEVSANTGSISSLSALAGGGRSKLRLRR